MVVLCYERKKYKEKFIAELDAYLNGQSIWQGPGRTSSI